ncbi:MAG: hypothetical protein ABIP97_09290 [Chthoniobacterales bacterium]
MRPITAALLILCAFCLPLTARANPYLDFDGTRFYLAYAPNDPSDHLRQYVPAGESMDHWNRMLSSQLYKNLHDPEQYIKTLAHKVQGGKPEKNYELYIDKKKNMYLLEFVDISHRNFVECNIMQANYEKGVGLNLWRYSWRIYNVDKMNEKQLNSMAARIRKDMARIVPKFWVFDFHEKVSAPAPNRANTSQ